ncbi:ParB/RepB/Spo0J family partition protein [Streptomyces bacillaris]|uniref:ParB/RepB/Spo0J family partition protein n=1 Tax=Streptomyces bacillaris TaxID=68179 RepID=UPI0033545838
MDIRRVPMGRINASAPLRPLPADLSRMVDSIRTVGLAEPVLVSHADMRIVSGYTRFAAYQQLEKSDIEAVMVHDVVEAASQLGSHVTDPDPTLAVRMDAASRFELFHRILGLGRPAGIPTEQRIDCALIAATATGFPDRTIRCLRRALRYTQATGSKSSAIDAEDAKRYLAAMLHMCDTPPREMTSHSAVQFLFGKMRSGASPEFLKEITAADRDKRKSATPEGICGKSAANKQKHASTKRMEKNVRLGVENISGALEGLESLLRSYTLETETREYLNLEFNRQVKKIQKIQQKISRRNNEAVKA